MWARAVSRAGGPGSAICQLAPAAPHPAISKAKPLQGSKGLSEDARKDHDIEIFLELEVPAQNLSLGGGPFQPIFVEESGLRSAKRARRRLAGAARAQSHVSRKTPASPRIGPALSRGNHLSRKMFASPRNGPGVDSWGWPSPRNGPTVDSWKRPRPGVGGQGVALAVPLAISHGKPPDWKEAVRRPAEGSRNYDFSGAGGADGSRHPVFSRAGGPGTQFVFRQRAAPLAICRGKLPPAHEKDRASTRGGGPGAPGRHFS